MRKKLETGPWLVITGLWKGALVRPQDVCNEAGA